MARMTRYQREVLGHRVNRWKALLEKEEIPGLEHLPKQVAIDEIKRNLKRDEDALRANSPKR